MLSDQVEEAACSTDPMDPLCLHDRPMFVPSQPDFAQSTNLRVFFRVLDFGLDEAKKPWVDVTFELRSKSGTRPWKPSQFGATPGYLPDSVLVLAAFKLEELEPGEYSHEATAGDRMRQSQSLETARLVAHGLGSSRLLAASSAPSPGGVTL